DFLKECMRHYPNSLIMRYANLKAQYSLMKFMVDSFLPVWKREILRHMNDANLNQIDEDTILEGIHAKLYIEGGFSAKELDIFRSTDPQGYDNYMKSSAKQIFHEDGQTPAGAVQNLNR
ncbi:MAG: hypothetical protein OEZ36_09700, partial [Spirochaetota bacterium]|nr:hypothetical protein [Spirochaetota bacterium]